MLPAPPPLATRVLSSLFGGDSGTHMHIIGSSGSGKSKFLEHIARDAFFDHHGFAVLDWHGTLYDSLLNYFTYLWPGRSIYLLDPSRGQYITPYNPFMNHDSNIGATAARYVDATVKAWGAQGTNQTPRLEKIARTLYYFAIAAGETLPNAELLLRYNHREVLEYAMRTLEGPSHAHVRENLSELAAIDKPARWDEYVQSTNNRLTRFLGDESMRRFLAFKTGNLDIAKLMAEDAVLLVNLSESDTLSADTARVFASFLLADFYRAAMRRAGTDQRFMLVLDEFQEYVSPDAGRMLDAVRKGGLHLIMAHQRMGHLASDEGMDLRDAINTNARIKAAFAVHDFETAHFLAPQLGISEMNADTVKDEITNPHVVGYDLEAMTSHTEFSSRSSSESAGYRLWDGTPGHSSSAGTSAGSSAGTSVTTSYQRVPILEDRVSSRTFYSLEEKRHRIAERIMLQPDRQLTIRIGIEPPEAYIVPQVSDYSVRQSSRDDYERSRFQEMKAVTPQQADAELERSRAEFLERVSPPKKARNQAPTRPPRT
jgi:hypothetical protein